MNKEKKKNSKLIKKKNLNMARNHFAPHIEMKMWIEI